MKNLGGKPFNASNWLKYFGMFLMIVSKLMLLGLIGTPSL